MDDDASVLTRFSEASNRPLLGSAASTSVSTTTNPHYLSYQPSRSHKAAASAHAGPPSDVCPGAPKLGFRAGILLIPNSDKPSTFSRISSAGRARFDSNYEEFDKILFVGPDHNSRDSADVPWSRLPISAKHMEVAPGNLYRLRDYSAVNAPHLGYQCTPSKKPTPKAVPATLTLTDGSTIDVGSFRLADTEQAEAGVDVIPGFNIFYGEVRGI